jgi:UDP-2,3-diacylglucosamine pyrophosphatase LpxH
MEGTNTVPAWEPDWSALMRAAQSITLEPIALGDAPGYVYLVADSHLGAAQAPPEGFIAMLRRLPQARAVVFLGDLFQVWLGLPKFWDSSARSVLSAFAELREQGICTIFIVGNREFFLPASVDEARRRGLPFDWIVPGACVLAWHGRRYGLTHGDLASRHDIRYLQWRYFSRSWGFEAVFRALPGPVAQRIAQGLERALATTNRVIKIQYPADDLQAFAQAVLPGLDGFFIGHFHRDEVFRAPGQPAVLRIVPDWYSRKAVVRLDALGQTETLHP